MRERTKQISFRTTYEEYKEIKLRAEKVGLDISNYLRSIGTGYEPKEKPPIEFYEAIKQIRAVGNNINQIARLANSNGYIDELSCKKQFDNLNNLIVKIKKEFLLPEKK